MRGILAACPQGKCAIASGLIIASSPLLHVAVSESLASGAGRDVANGWFVQIANLDTRPHVASATAVCQGSDYQWMHGHPAIRVISLGRRTRRACCHARS